MSFGLTTKNLKSVKAGLAVLVLLGIIGEALAQSDPSYRPADGWKKEWEKTVEAAKKEGQVTIYIGGWGAVLDAGVFQKAYPDIKVVGITGRGGEIAKRILAERRAEKYLADVSSEGVGSNYRILHGAKGLDPIKPALILPEVVDESRWWQGRHRYMDPEGNHIFRYVGVPQMGNISYSAKLVDPKEFKSIWDFLDPKWRGRILARDIRDPGPGNAPMRFFYHHPEIGPNFLRRLFGEMDITLFRDFRQGVDWLASGKFSLCFFCSDIDKAKLQGLSIEEFGMMKEGTGLHTQYGTLAFVNRAPHANAAKVFINWFLSREGQLTLQRALAKSAEEAPDSLRIDIPKEDVKPQNRRWEGVRYLDLDSRPDWIDMKPVLQVFEEALAEAGKRKAGR